MCRTHISHVRVPLNGFLYAYEALGPKGCVILAPVVLPTSTSVRNKIPASRCSSGRLVQGYLVIFAWFFLTAGETAMHRFESDAKVIALFTARAAHVLQDYTALPGSWRMMTPGLASRTGLLPFNVMQTPAPSWAHNLAGLQPRRQILRAPSSAGLAVVCLHCQAGVPNAAGTDADFNLHVLGHGQSLRFS